MPPMPPAPNAPEECRVCRFFAAGNAAAAAKSGFVNPNGWCRRHPASLRKAPDEWCGEFRAAPNTAGGAERAHERAHERVAA